MKKMHVAVIGTVGVPANYGGFETLAENLVKYHDAESMKSDLTVYCSSRSYPARGATYFSAHLRYVPLNANGAQSIPYDIVSLFSAVWNRSDVILLLGVSGAVALPFIRLLSSARIITNIDGIEWRREKWKGLAKNFLRFSEKMAVRFSHEVIADNAAIAEYVEEIYGVNAHVIAYGGDHAMAIEATPVNEYALPAKYAFSVCRIEPENNIHMVLEAFPQQSSIALVMVGNWNNSEYGRDLRERFGGVAHLHLLDPIYELGKLKSLRAGATMYVHGHSAGGTNPSLVEAMHFGLPVLAYDCDFNRATTENKAIFFKDADSLRVFVASLDEVSANKVGRDMTEVANRRYTWHAVAKEYFDLLLR
jgi:glycosyltransferase involved in cell wall biosynthesis